MSGTTCKTLDDTCATCAAALTGYFPGTVNCDNCEDEVITYTLADEGKRLRVVSGA